MFLLLNRIKSKNSYKTLVAESKIFLSSYPDVVIIYIMKLHPAEIAKEIKNYSFFKSFREDLLLQICTMTELKIFSKDEFLLKENEKNTKLYFIRKGFAEILLAGEVVAILQNAGEVMGEMSVVLNTPATSTIRAASSLECWVLDSENFAHVNPKDLDHFQSLLYRIYSIVLADRLTKTNEKARFFEIANRELHQAQMALDTTGNKKVLLVDSDRKQLVMAKVAVGSTGVKMDTASDLATAQTLVATNPYDAVICDEQSISLLKELSDSNNPAKLIMMTSKFIKTNLKHYRGNEFVNTIITRDVEDRPLTIRTMLTTLTKILSQDIFGLEKYLSWGVEVQTRTVKSSIEREELKSEMVNYFRHLGVRQTVLDRCNTVAEELLMNAIYDAPMDSNRKSLFNHYSRRTEVRLETHLQSQFKYACDGMHLALAVVDPFGGLTKDIIINYLESCYEGQAGTLNDEKGGAGRGLHQIIENSDLTIFNVKKNFRTEVISLFYVESNKKEPQPSFHYFFT